MINIVNIAIPKFFFVYAYVRYFFCFLFLFFFRLKGLYQLYGEDDLIIIVYNS